MSWNESDYKKPKNLLSPDHGITPIKDKPPEYTPRRAIALAYEDIIDEAELDVPQSLKLASDLIGDGIMDQRSLDFYRRWLTRGIQEA